MSTLGKFVAQDSNKSVEAVYQHFKEIPLLAIGKEILEFDKDRENEHVAFNEGFGYVQKALRKVFPEKYQEFLAIPDNKITLEHVDLLNEIESIAVYRGEDPKGMLECQCKVVKIANRMSDTLDEAREVVEKQENAERAAILAQRKSR